MIVRPSWVLEDLKGAHAVKDKAKQVWAQEPAVTIGAVASVVAVVAEAVAGAPTWKAAVPALLSLVIRHFVVPATRE